MFGYSMKMDEWTISGMGLAFMTDKIPRLRAEFGTMWDEMDLIVL